MSEKRRSLEKERRSEKRRDSFHIQNNVPSSDEQQSDTSESDSSSSMTHGDDGLGVRVECAVCNVRLGAQAMTMHLQVIIVMKGYSSFNYRSRGHLRSPKVENSRKKVKFRSFLTIYNYISN